MKKREDDSRRTAISPIGLGNLIYLITKLSIGITFFNEVPTFRTEIIKPIGVDHRSIFPHSVLFFLFFFFRHFKALRFYHNVVRVLVFQTTYKVSALYDEDFISILCHVSPRASVDVGIYTSFFCNIENVGERGGEKGKRIARRCCIFKK